MKEFFAICGTIIVAVVLVFGFVAWIYLSVEVGVEGARIEQLREDAAAVGEPLGEDVLGQATEANQTIAGYRFWNDTFLGFLVPDEWDTIEYIPVR